MKRNVVKVGGGIFICYSHKDRRWLERLQVHLKALNQDILVWGDTKNKTSSYKDNLLAS
jgi:hypothetical protein